MKKKLLESRAVQIRRKLADNIRKRREQLGLSQQELADAAGVHRTYMSLIERKLSDPSFLIVWRLATVLKMKISDLLR